MKFVRTTRLGKAIAGLALVAATLAAVTLSTSTAVPTQNQHLAGYDTSPG